MSSAPNTLYCPLCPFLPVLANLPASVLLGSTHQHSGRCHLATACRLQHTRQNKNPVQRENKPQGGLCDRGSLTHRRGVGTASERGHFTPPPHPIVPRTTGGKSPSPITPSGRLLLSSRHIIFSHTEPLRRPGSSAAAMRISWAWLLYDTHETSIEIMMSILSFWCKSAW